jgi:hypothetical protein
MEDIMKRINKWDNRTRTMREWGLAVGRRSRAWSCPCPTERRDRVNITPASYLGDHRFEYRSRHI